MFEMLFLLINEINPHSFSFVICVIFIFTCEALPYKGLFHTFFCIAYLIICRGILPQEFVVAICCRSKLWAFAAWIWRGHFPRKFVVGICRGFFVYVSESFFFFFFFFVYVSKSCLYGSRSFLYVSKTFCFVKFSLLTVFLFVIIVAVMGYRSLELKFLILFLFLLLCHVLNLQILLYQSILLNFHTIIIFIKKQIWRIKFR